MGRGFFADKYGWDRFSYFLLIAGGFFIFTGRSGFIFGIPLVAYAIYRATSRNFQARRKESMIFERYVYSFNSSMNRFVQRIKRVFKKEGTKTHVIISCPKCGQKLRLPRGKGKVIITCQKCSNEFKYKS